MMKFVNGFPQEELACMVDVMIGKDKKPHEVRIDAADTLILQWLLHFYPRMNKKKVNDEEYAYISYKKVVEDLPILNTTKRAVAARFKKIEHFGLVKMLVEKDEFGTYTYIHLTKKYFSLLETADGGCPSKNNGVVPRHATKNSKLENSKIRANISQQTDSSANDAPIPAESVRCTSKYNNNYGTAKARMMAKQSYPVVQANLDGSFVKLWPSAKSAQRTGLYHQCNISRCANHEGNNRTHKGYLWIYREEYEEKYGKLTEKKENA